MSELNREVQNQDFGVGRTEEEYWTNCEAAIGIQSTVPGSYDTNVEITPKNMTKIANGGNGRIIISPAGSPFEIYYMPNTYVDFECLLTQTINIFSEVACTTPVTSSATLTNANGSIFCGLPNTLALFNTYAITASTSEVDKIATGGCYNLAKILNVMLNDQVKDQFPNAVTSYEAVQNQSNNVCGFYQELTGLINGNSIASVAHFRLPLWFFNILARLKFIPNFFGEWVLSFTPTYGNFMYCSAPSFSGTTTANTTLQLANTFSGVGQVFATQGTTPYYVKLTPTNLQVTNYRLNAARYELTQDSWGRLFQAYAERPLSVPFYQTLSTQFELSSSSSLSSAVVKVPVPNVDGAIITFHSSSTETSVSRQPFATNFKVTTEAIGVTNYPKERQDMATYNDYLCRQMTLDTFNLSANVLSAIPKELYYAMYPYMTYYANSTDSAAGSSSTIHYFTDKTSFLLGIPFAADGGFMCGLSPKNDEVTFKFTGTMSPALLTTAYGTTVTGITHLEVTTLTDYILQVRASEKSSPNQVAVTTAPLNLPQIA